MVARVANKVGPSRPALALDKLRGHSCAKGKPGRCAAGQARWGGKTCEAPLGQAARSRHRSSTACSASSSDSGAGSEGGAPEGARVLPIFPLSVVALPFTSVPLHIFEARYRVLFSTLLAGEAGIEEGLVDKDSEFLGTKEFGLCYTDEAGSVASVGALLRVEQHEKLADGRLYLQNAALRRFKVVEVVEQRPVLVCKVEFLPEDEASDSDPEVISLAREVGALFLKAVRLGYELEGVQEDVEDPEELAFPPSKLSYWLAGLFPQDLQEQQALLQVQGTRDRLEAEKEIFQATYNYHLARSSIKSAFPAE